MGRKICWFLRFVFGWTFLRFVFGWTFLRVVLGWTSKLIPAHERRFFFPHVLSRMSILLTLLFFHQRKRSLLSQGKTRKRIDWKRHKLQIVPSRSFYWCSSECVPTKSDFLLLKQSRLRIRPNLCVSAPCFGNAIIVVENGEAAFCLKPIIVIENGE